MCGIVGIISHQPVRQDLFDALTVLQHRGQDAAGVITTDGDHFYLRKANGLVRDVFRQRHMERLHGHAGIGHVRYPTAGSSSESEAQPFYINAPYGIALAHNGNLTNYQELRNELTTQDRRHINTESDSEVLLNILAHELDQESTQTPKALFAAVKRTMKRAIGGYAAVAMIAGLGLVAFRDPHGIRPLTVGRRKVSGGYDYMVASESVALDTLGFTPLEDIGPGQAILIDFNGELHRQDCLTDALTPCAFEFVYLARPDSVIDGISVHEARLNLGRNLAEQIVNEWPDHDINVVIPIPDTSRTAALPIAERLQVPMRDGFVKNRYIGRTFIMPEQAQRKKSVRKKLNPIGVEFKGKNVLLVDDSIVRGTTCKQIIQMAKDAGAKKVYFASAAPPVRYPNVYGIDMPARQELIAHNKDIEEIRKLIAADKLFYQSLDGLTDALKAVNPSITKFEASVFDGKYIAGEINEQYMQQLEGSRSNDAKQKRNGNSSSVIDLSNAII